MTETAQRGGHIPGAANIPWSQAVKEDSTFKSAEGLRALYESRGVDLSKETVAYCRIGRRASHTWSVLRYLLGVLKVRNYDGSWTEGGNLVGAPVEREGQDRAMLRDTGKTQPLRNAAANRFGRRCHDLQAVLPREPRARVVLRWLRADR